MGRPRIGEVVFSWDGGLRQKHRVLAVREGRDGRCQLLVTPAVNGSGDWTDISGFDMDHSVEKENGQGPS